MSDLYTYSLVPVWSVALLLAFDTLVRHPKARPLGLYCLSIAMWSGLLFVSQIPQCDGLLVRFSSFGAVVAATHVHAMYALLDWPSRGMVAFAYLVSFGLMLCTALFPGLLTHEFALQSGPWSLPSMALAGLLSLLPLELLLRSEKTTTAHQTRLALLILAGILCFVGGWGTILLLSLQRPMPYGMLLVLASLLLLAHLVHHEKSPHEQRLLERSFLYATLAALLSAGFLFGVLWLLSLQFRPTSQEYYLGVLFMFFMAALAFEPLRQVLLDRLGRALLRHRTSLTTIANEFAAQEERTEQAERLAELGTFASAVAHEVRNPLGVLKAHLRLLERQGVERDALEQMHEQIDRANHFIDDLLAYGRPRPLELRTFALGPLLELAVNTAHSGLGPDAPRFALEIALHQPELALEADQSQLMQVFVILAENALLAMSDTETPKLSISSEDATGGVRLFWRDNGPGIALVHRTQIFAPFFTTRKRDSTHTGTGLGLAIARKIIERHGGTIAIWEPSEADDALVSPQGGACFVLELPLRQPIFAATPPKPKEGEDACEEPKASL